MWRGARQRRQLRCTVTAPANLTTRLPLSPRALHRGNVSFKQPTAIMFKRMSSQDLGGTQPHQLCCECDQIWGKIQIDKFVPKYMGFFSVCIVVTKSFPYEHALKFSINHFYYKSPKTRTSVMMLTAPLIKWPP